MNIYAGTATGNKLIVDPVIGTALGNKQVQQIWAGTAAGNKLVYSRQQLAVSGVATAWSAIRLTITPPGVGADVYTIERNGSQIYSGAVVATYDDTGLSAGTEYVYKVYAQKAGQVVGVALTNRIVTGNRTTTQKTVTLTATAVASYNESGSKRTDTSDLYYGRYSSNHGKQRSQWLFAFPADMRNCVSIDSFKVSIWNVHTYPNGGTNSELVVHHNPTLGATYGGSTGRVAYAWAGKPSWWNNTEWTEAKDWTSAGRTSVREEFRVNGAYGFGLQAIDGSAAQSAYGYASGTATKPRCQVTYTVWAP